MGARSSSPPSISTTPVFSKPAVILKMSCGALVSACLMKLPSLRTVSSKKLAASISPALTSSAPRLMSFMPSLSPINAPDPNTMRPGLAFTSRPLPAAPTCLTSSSALLVMVTLSPVLRRPLINSLFPLSSTSWRARNSPPRRTRDWRLESPSSVWLRISDGPPPKTSPNSSEPVEFSRPIVSVEAPASLMMRTFEFSIVTISLPKNPGSEVSKSSESFHCASSQ